jgi:hypothetical protein
VTGSNPKDYLIEVSCQKGSLTFDFEMQQLAWPDDFNSYCKEKGAIWAIFFENEIKAALEKYLS